MLSGKWADKLMFVAIYAMAALLVIWGARGIANYAMDANFYHDYLLQWEVRLLALRHQQPVWPPFNPQDPLLSMQNLVTLMEMNGLQPPKSNTARVYTYRLNKMGEKPAQILLICKESRLILYGLPATTFDRLDRFIDGQPDPDSGDFTGKWSTDRITRIAQWKL